MAPAGRVKRKNGIEALVAISDKRRGEAPSEFMSHVAAVSWAETQQPETRLAIQSARKTRFFNASQVEVFGVRSVTIAQETGFRIQDSRREFKDVRKLPRMSLSQNLSVGHNQKLKTKVTEKEVRGETEKVKRPE